MADAGDDITQRMMEAEQIANQQIASSDFQHTIGNQALAADLSGIEVRNNLMKRARQREELIESLGGDQTLEYSNAHTAKVGTGADVLRQAAQNRQELRKKLNERFSKNRNEHKDDDVRIRVSRRNKASRDRRQAFNAGHSPGGAESSGTSTESHAPRSRQEHNSAPRFREPPSRGYNPYA